MRPPTRSDWARSRSKATPCSAGCWASPLAARADDDLRRRYFSVMHRRGRPKAKVALARKLLVRLYIMLRDQIDYIEFRRRGRAPRLQPRSVATM
jgi:hypothetical protein